MYFDRRRRCLLSGRRSSELASHSKPLTFFLLFSFAFFPPFFSILNSSPTSLQPSVHGRTIHPIQMHQVDSPKGVYLPLLLLLLIIIVRIITNECSSRP